LNRALIRHRYMAGDVIKMAVVLDHKANLREVRVIFAHAYDEHASVMGRGTPHPISDRDSDGSIRSHVNAEIALPRGVTPGVYKLVRVTTRQREVGSDTSQKTRDYRTPSRAPSRWSGNPRTHPT
jgi:hypothetical protein